MATLGYCTVGSNSLEKAKIFYDALLGVAGILEAFLSPSGAPVGVKFAVGAVLLTGLGFWLVEGGRRTG